MTEMSLGWERRDAPKPGENAPGYMQSLSEVVAQPCET